MLCDRRGRGHHRSDNHQRKNCATFMHDYPPAGEIDCPHRITVMLSVASENVSHRQHRSVLSVAHLFTVSVKHDSNPDAEVVLCAVKQSRRVVVKLYRPDRNTVARPNIESTSKRARESRLACREIRRTRTRDHRDANVVIEIDAIAGMRDAHKCMREWLERPLCGVVF